MNLSQDELRLVADALLTHTVERDGTRSESEIDAARELRKTIESQLDQSGE